MATIEEFTGIGPDLPQNFEVIRFAAIDPWQENSRKGIPIKNAPLEDVLLDMEHQGKNVPFRIREFVIARFTQNIGGLEMTFESNAPISRSGYLFPDGVVFSRRELHEISDNQELIN